MPPEENKNTPQPEFSPLRVDIDPIFRGATKKEETQPTGAFNLLSNQQYTPSHKQNATEISGTTLVKKEGKTLLRTYKDDIAQAIQANHLSSINIAIAENEKMHNKIDRGAEIENLGKDYKKSKILFIISFILVIIGIGFFLFSYFGKTTEIERLPGQNSVPNTIMSADYRDELSINNVIKDRFVSALSSKINDIQIPVNNIYSTYITSSTGTEKRLITTEEFINFTNLRVPDILKRTLSPDFMVGMFSFGQDLPFVIFKTSSFENAYAGMLDWEKNLEKDFYLLFRLNSNYSEKDLVTSLTPSATHLFEDGVVVNRDVRIIREGGEKIILLYGILNKDTIVITVNDVVFKELINRLNKERSIKR